MTPPDRMAPPGQMALPRHELTPIEFDPFAGDAGERHDELPLTDPQQEVWSAAQMAPAASTAYNQCFPVRLSGSIAVDSLRCALQQLSRRHAALRVSFSD